MRDVDALDWEDVHVVYQTPDQGSDGRGEDKGSSWVSKTAGLPRLIVDVFLLEAE